MSLLFWFSLLVLVLVALLLLDAAVGVNKIKYLVDTPAIIDSPAPKVSLIFSALNEAEHIERALRSMLAVDYANLEIIAINDRSSDATGQVLDKLATQFSQLRVLHIQDLPAGWLGKNHALYRGAQIAGGEYLIFTDADVIFQPGTITRAVAYCQHHQVDHLPVLFQVITRSSLLGMLILSFILSFLGRYKPWKVSNSPKYFLGVGAFNMVRKSAYDASGGHTAIPMVVLDDMMLGKLLKTKGFRQHALNGKSLIAVEWYPSTRAMFIGMQKNIFSAFDYQISKLLGLTLVMAMVRIWPWIGLFSGDHLVRWINLTTILLGFVMYIYLAIANQQPLRCLLWFPLISFIELALWWQGSMLTIWRGGIVWRGTHYDLDELKRGHF